MTILSLKTSKTIHDIDVQTFIDVIQNEHKCICHIVETSPLEIYIDKIIDESHFSNFNIIQHIQYPEDSYKIISRLGKRANLPFHYKGTDFNSDQLHFIPGLCAFDTLENAQKIFIHLRKLGISWCRMGVFKPRTSPYTFQGIGEKTLRDLFLLATDENMTGLVLEVMSEKHADAIDTVLQQSDIKTGCIVQVGTRNAQNFELLKHLGQLKEYPVLFKRGFGISLKESLDAAEYIAYYGNTRIIFCLRGMKSTFADPHRNFVDFNYVSALDRMIRLPICIDPSHAVGHKLTGTDNIPDLYHAASQGVVSGANILLLDIHPTPSNALVDKKQALTFRELEWFIEDMKISHQCYRDRKRLCEKVLHATDSTRDKITL